MDIRDRIIVKQREIIELYTKYLSDFTKHFGIPNFWEKEFDGKLHEIASLEKEISELFKGMYPEEFIIWLTQKLRLNELIFLWDTNKYYMYDNDKEFVLYGLYQYWIDNIKDKKD